jgi:hypothetical protein
VLLLNEQIFEQYFNDYEIGRHKDYQEIKGGK